MVEDFITITNTTVVADMLRLPDTRGLLPNEAVFSPFCPADTTVGPVPDGVSVVPVECLSACNQGCSVALSAPGRWSYVYGRLSDAHASDVVAGAAAYGAAPDGLVPWRSRPEIFRKQSLARIPPILPLAVVPEAAE